MRLISGLAAAIALSFGSLMPATAHPPVEETRRRAGDMAEAAARFMEALTPEQRVRVARRFDDDRARTNWSNLPSTMVERDGVALATLTELQRRAFHDMLVASMSSQGYAKTATIMWFDDLLRLAEIERYRTSNLTTEERARRNALTASRSSGNYWVAVFGEPGDARWGWMVSGHHLAANFTVVDGHVAFTPLFVGANPQIVASGPYAGFRVLDHEIVRGFQLARSLDARQRQGAVLADSISDDLFTGRGRKDSLRAMVGLSAAALNPGQQEMLWSLIREFVGAASEEAAQAQLAAIRADGLDQLRFAWWGSTSDPRQRFMYRIHGPSILIEYVRERDGDGPGNHVHAIVRDPRNDYGEDWLGRHYTEWPHP